MNRIRLAFAGFLVIQSAAAQITDCPGDSTAPTCVETRRILALTAATQAQTAAMTTQAAAITALNKTRFEVPNSAETKPAVGLAASSGTEFFFPKCLAGEAMRAAAAAIAKNITACPSTGPGIAVYRSIVTPGLLSAVAERQRLKPSLIALQAHIDSVASLLEPDPSPRIRVSAMTLSSVGSAINGLAAIAGLFVSDYAIASVASGGSENVVKNAVLTELINRAAEPGNSVQTDTSQIDSEVKTVNIALVNLHAAILELKKRLSQATPDTPAAKRMASDLESANIFKTAARATLAEIFKVAVGATKSPNVQAATLDTDSANICAVLELNVEKSGGAQVSAVKPFSSV